MNKIGIFIASTIAVLVIIIVVLCVFINNKNNVKYIEFASLDNKYKVTVPDNFNYAATRRY